tara:strand:- start:184 stop:822 length:639 start_codon:yes stop_codon:yes gene_type:complete
MKKKMLTIGTASLFMISLATFTGCGGTDQKNEHEETTMDHGHGGREEHHHDHANGDMDVSSMNVEQSTSATEVINAYLEIKNALTEDDDTKAALAGKKLVTAFGNIDKSFIPQEQMGEVNDIIENAKENAEHISDNKGNIEHQREHLSELFEDIKDLIAITGSDRALYEIYCPMANNNEGGMWLSASDEVKNPFMGSQMLSCGTVKAEISLK